MFPWQTNNILVIYNKLSSSGLTGGSVYKVANVFSILASVISILLLGTTTMLTIIESKSDVNLLKLLGIRTSDIDLCFIVQATIQGLISYMISSLELIIIDIMINYMFGNMFKVGLNFSLNIRPLFIVLVFALFIPIFVSGIMLLILNKKHIKA